MVGLLAIGLSEPVAHVRLELSLQWSLTLPPGHLVPLFWLWVIVFRWLSLAELFSEDSDDGANFFPVANSSSRNKYSTKSLEDDAKLGGEYADDDFTGRCCILSSSESNNDSTCLFWFAVNDGETFLADTFGNGAGDFGSLAVLAVAFVVGSDFFSVAFDCFSLRFAFLVRLDFFLVDLEERYR
ncbi:uncharacterized protein LOC135840148 [Planococcus citri]|uniref:uncharacterized protein LOC135840148 n=1 Tax=Planococcus citri TaxID=170843 RepID=UPI0031F8FDAE